MQSWQVRYRWLILLLWLAALAIAFMGMGNLKFINDYKVFFSDDNPDLIAFEKIEEKYSGNDSVLIAIAPKTGDVFQPEVLKAILDLTDRGWQTPHSYRVDSLSNYQHTTAVENDLIVSDFISSDFASNSSELKDKKELALKLPELVNRYISQDGRSTAINVLVKLPGESQSEEVREVAQFWQDIKADAEKLYPNTDFYLTGQIMQNDAFGEASQRDMGSLVPLALLLIVVGTGIYLRSAWSVFLVTVTIISSIILALGSAGWLGINITSPSASAPIIILTMAVADCIHFLQGFRKYRGQGVSKHEAITSSLKVHKMPIILTSITTAIGFLSMNFSDSPPFHDLGNITAMGVIWAMLLSLSFVPSLMAVLPMPKASSGKVRFLGGPLSFISSIATGKPMLVLSSLLVIAIAVAVNLKQNVIDDTLFEYFDDSYSIRQANDFTYANLTGVASLQFAISPKDGQQVTSPEFLNNLDTFVEQARKDPGVYHIQSLTDIMKRLNSNLHQDSAEFYQIPEDPDLSAQVLLLYDMSLPYGLNLSNQVATDKRELRLIVTARKMSSNQLIDLESRLRTLLLQRFDKSQITPGVSADLIFAHIGYRNNISMLTVSLIALVLISALIGVMLRSVRLGLISVLPNLLPAAVAFGAWGLTIGEVGLSLSVVAGMTLGIVVDDTIHLLYRYYYGRKAGKPEQEAIEDSVRETGLAIIGTTFVLSMGFFVLATSSFKMNADMGLMTATTIMIALVLDLLLIPSLLKLTSKSKVPEELGESVTSS